MLLDVMTIRFSTYFQVLPLNNKEENIHVSRISPKTIWQLPTNTKSKKIILIKAYPRKRKKSMTVT